MSSLNTLKKRILIFSTAYYPFVGGAEVAIKEITDRLGGEYEFDLITGRFQKDLLAVENVGKVTVYRIGSGRPILDKILLPFAGAMKVWKLEKEKKYDFFWGVMVTFGSGAGYVFNVLRRFTGKVKIPMILTLQEGDSESHLRYRWGGLINLSWWLALRQSDFLTGISNFLLHRAEQMGYKGSVALIPNGVDTKIFSRVFSEDEKKNIREKFLKKEGDIFLVTTSRLVRKNAVDDIISSLTYLPENISLLVIGKGEEGLGLQEKAVGLKVADRVKFLGFISHQDIPQYFSICDIFVRPSRSEGFGNSFIEAMAAGLPVIATPVGGIADFLDDKETGVFCSLDNPKSVAEAVKLLIEDQSLTSKIVTKAKARVVELYDWDCIAREMKEKVFDRVVSS